MPLKSENPYGQPPEGDSSDEYTPRNLTPNEAKEAGIFEAFEEQLRLTINREIAQSGSLSVEQLAGILAGLYNQPNLPKGNFDLGQLSPSELEPLAEMLKSINTEGGLAEAASTQTAINLLVSYLRRLFEGRSKK